jgi:hypothetical protein
MPCTRCCPTGLFCKQEKMYPYNDKLGTRIILPPVLSHPSLTLCLRQPFPLVHNSHGLLLTSCIHTCPITTALLGAWVGWHFLQDVGLKSVPCANAHLPNLSQSLVSTLAGGQYTPLDQALGHFCSC